MILFIYPFGKRIRSLAPDAHSLAEILHARHGSSSQRILAGSNIIGGILSLVSNYLAGSVLIAMLTPLNFSTGILVIAAGVLLYTLWSGLRASILTDFIQVCGRPRHFPRGPEQSEPAAAQLLLVRRLLQSGRALHSGGAGLRNRNQTIAQRLFAVRPDKIKAT